MTCRQSCCTPDREGDGMTPSVEERVRAGAKWLDKRLPGWERKVKISTLHLSDEYRCVLGQLSPHFAKVCPEVEAEVEVEGYHYSAVTSALAELKDGRDEDLGFDISTYGQYGHEPESEYRELDEAWKAEIRKRRARA